MCRVRSVSGDPRDRAVREASRRGLRRGAAGLAGARALPAARPAADRRSLARDRATRRLRHPAHLARVVGDQLRLGEGGAGGAPRGPPTRRGPRHPEHRLLHGHHRSREHARRLRHPAGTDGAAAGGRPQVCGAVLPRREAVGRMPVADERAGPGRRHDARAVHRVPVRRRPHRLARARARDGEDRRALRRREGGADRRRGHRPHLQPRGRKGKVSGAGANMPSGEVFYSPVEDTANGVVTFSEYPAYYFGRDVHGARLRFENGRAVEITAGSNEDFFKSVLTSDEGAVGAGRVRDRMQPGHPGSHAQHALRREDRGDDPPRDGQRLPDDRRERTRAPSTGTWSRTCDAAASSTSKASSCRRTVPGSSRALHARRPSPPRVTCSLYVSSSAAADAPALAMCVRRACRRLAASTPRRRRRAAPRSRKE